MAKSVAGCSPCEAHLYLNVLQRLCEIWKRNMQVHCNKESQSCKYQLKCHHKCLCFDRSCLIKNRPFSAVFSLFSVELNGLEGRCGVPQAGAHGSAGEGCRQLTLPQLHAHRWSRPPDKSSQLGSSFLLNGRSPATM